MPVACSAFARTVHVWDPVTGEDLHTLDSDASRITAICMSSDCSVVAAGRDDGLVLSWKADQPA